MSHWDIYVAKETYLAAKKNLYVTILEHCPEHKPKQHRDRKPPWCDKCGYSDDGFLYKR